MMKVQITDAAKAVLVRGTINGNVFTLPPGQLPRPLYEEVNKVLDAGGGKWNRKLAGHVFPSAERLADLEQQWQNGDKVVHVKKATQAFYTPEPLARFVVALAGVYGYQVMEPSAGEGALVSQCLKAGARSVFAVEKDPVSVKRLKEQFKNDSGSDVFPVCVYEGDFLTDIKDNGNRFGRIVMNPPFTKGQDIEHVTHALRFLSPFGRLVAIMSPGWTRNARTAAVERFMGVLNKTRWETHEVEAGAFAESGTDIKTVILVAERRL